MPTLLVPDQSRSAVQQIDLAKISVFASTWFHRASLIRTIKDAHQDLGSTFWIGLWCIQTATGTRRNGLQSRGQGPTYRLRVRPDLPFGSPKTHRQRSESAVPVPHVPFQSQSGSHVSHLAGRDALSDTKDCRLDRAAIGSRACKAKVSMSADQRPQRGELRWYQR